MLCPGITQKQQPDKSLQEYIQNFMDLTQKAMGTDPANITNIHNFPIH